VHRLLAACVTAASLLFLTTSCGSDSGPSPGTGIASGGDARDGGAPAAQEIAADDFHPSLFDETSTTLDNEWVRYRTGTRFTWRGWTEEDDGTRIPHRIVFTVTDMTKVIGGVRARVGWDRDFSAGELVESELIFFAQDKNGNVWHLGQYSETYEEGGQFVGGSAWLVGNLKGAKAGIHMKAEPRLGTPAYSQGFAPAPYYWDDWSKVYRTGRRTCVPVGCYRNAVVIDEYEPTKPGAHQLKYYVRGVGNVRTGWSGRDPEREVLVLSKVVRLGPRAMATARAQVRRHEARAYVYGRTAPAE
jgi:hypothetical protein